MSDDQNVHDRELYDDLFDFDYLTDCSICLKEKYDYSLLIAKMN